MHRNMKFRKITLGTFLLAVGVATACSTNPQGPPGGKGGENADRDTEQNGGEGGDGGNGESRCTSDASCLPLKSRPEDCAVATCDRDTGECEYKPEDADRDGFPTKRCLSLDPAVSLNVGTDCNDGEAKINPTSWDGPAVDDLPNGCDDELDNDCSGTYDDGVLEDGTTCACTPNETSPCALDPNGKQITFPVLDEDGLPVGDCKLGSRTCLPNGTWGECDGAVGPSTETCDGQDNDCDGVASLEDPDTKGSTWACDADADDHLPSTDLVTVDSCMPPTSGCSGQWLDLASTSKRSDCDDSEPNINPSALERCNRRDDDCSKGDGIEIEEDVDNDGHSPVGYLGCDGGFPKDDCVDTNGDVFPGQSAYFSEPYCETETLSKHNDYDVWYCGVWHGCSGCPTAKETPTYDYDCNGESQFPTGVCTTGSCGGPNVPSTGPCGSVQELKTCVIVGGGKSCAYVDTTLTAMVTCR